MIRYLVLVNFQERGFLNIAESPARAERFHAAAEAMGASIESIYWTLGPYDGVFVITAPDETVAAGLVLQLGRDGNVRTTMLRAFDADEFTDVLVKASAEPGE